MKIQDSNWKVPSSGYSAISDRKGWADGEVFTPQGIVSVYAQGDKENFHFTRLDFIWNGRCYTRSYQGKRYSHRAIKTLARKFAAEIAQEPA